MGGHCPTGTILAAVSEVNPLIVRVITPLPLAVRVWVVPGWPVLVLYQVTVKEAFGRCRLICTVPLWAATLFPFTTARQVCCALSIQTCAQPDCRSF